MAAVALFYFEDHPLLEVADVLGCSHSAAKVHVFISAEQELRELSQEGKELGDRFDGQPSGEQQDVWAGELETYVAIDVVPHI